MARAADIAIRAIVTSITVPVFAYFWVAGASRIARERARAILG
jgi:hypothetical protein